MSENVVAAWAAANAAYYGRDESVVDSNRVRFGDSRDRADGDRESGLGHIYLFGPIRFEYPLLEQPYAKVFEVWHKQRFSSGHKAVQFMLENQYPGVVCPATGEGAEFALRRHVVEEIIYSEGDLE